MGIVSRAKSHGHFPGYHYAWPRRDGADRLARVQQLPREGRSHERVRSVRRQDEVDRDPQLDIVCGVIEALQTADRCGTAERLVSDAVAASRLLFSLIVRLSHTGQWSRPYSRFQCCVRLVGDGAISGKLPATAISCRMASADSISVTY